MIKPMGKNNVLIYTEWLEDAVLLGYERSGILYQNILRYQSEMELIEMDEATQIAFNPIKRCIDKDNLEYLKKCEKNKKNIEKRWKKTNIRTNTNVYDSISIDTKHTDNDNDNDNDNDIYIKDYKSIVDLYNRLCPSLSKVKSISNARKKAINARLKTYNIDAFEELFTKAEASDFLKGANARNWSATFDWLIKDSNMAKVLDGNYDNKPTNKPIKNTFNNFQGRDYDFDELEKKITGQ